MSYRIQPHRMSAYFSTLALVAAGCFSPCAVAGTLRVSDPIPDAVLDNGNGFDSLRRAEAEQLALEISGELRPPAELRDRILADLVAIRDYAPNMASITATAPWVVGEVMVGLTPEAACQFAAGQFAGFDKLFEKLGRPQVEQSKIGNYLHLSFDEAYHPEVLSRMFGKVEGVDWAGANGVFGGSTDIQANVKYLPAWSCSGTAATPTVGTRNEYTFTQGWGDCPSGCINSKQWRFVVENGNVIPMPEPSAFALLGICAASCLGLARPRRRAACRES